MLGKLRSMMKGAGRAPSTPLARRRPRSRLNLEPLEDRLCPSGATFWWSGNVNSDWFTPGNWHVDGMADGPLPGPNDTVEIPYIFASSGHA